MKLVVVGGQSRGVGKTSLVASIIEATRDLGWSAFKITQYGHGVCSKNGGACACAVDDPACPYSITRELDTNGRSDTSRFLRAGATETYWVRARMGQLGAVVPDLRRLLSGCEFAIMESNSILEFLRPDLYLSVLDSEVADFKTSCRTYLPQADGYVVVNAIAAHQRPAFRVRPPSYCNSEILGLVSAKLGMPIPMFP